MNTASIGQRVVTGMIVLNLPTAAWVEVTHSEIAERIDAGILLFFAALFRRRGVCANRVRYEAPQVGPLACC